MYCVGVTVDGRKRMKGRKRGLKGADDETSGDGMDGES